MADVAERTPMVKDVANDSPALVLGNIDADDVESVAKDSPAPAPKIGTDDMESVTKDSPAPAPAPKIGADDVESESSRPADGLASLNLNGSITFSSAVIRGNK